MTFPDRIVTALTEAYHGRVAPDGFPVMAYFDDKNRPWYDRRDIARLIELSESQAQTALDRLVALDKVEVTKLRTASKAAPRRVYSLKQPDRRNRFISDASDMKEVQ